MVLSTEWSQVEIIDLINDGSGLGFGIVGGRSTGVVIKSILPGGLADKDSRLQSGDHILQIGDINLRGLTAEQVATVLRQAGQQVRMVVARPVEPSSSDFLLFNYSAPIVPTRVLNDPEELDRQLVQNGFTNSYIQYIEGLQVVKSDNAQGQLENDTIPLSPNNFNEKSLSVKSTPNGLASVVDYLPKQRPLTPVTPIEHNSINSEPETEKITVHLVKDEFGLGITVAGYVCEKEALCGIFIKSLNEQSEAFKCGKIQINDRIIEVDGVSLENYSNYEAVKKLKETGNEVTITFERYLSGPKYEQLQEVIAGTERNNKDVSPASPSATTLSWIPIDTTEVKNDPDISSLDSANSVTSDQNPESKEIFVDENFQVNLEDDLESVIRQKWQDIIGDDADIVVANLTKLKGLGISLEGTVDVEGGIELRPHHYIRSILPEGPVGQNGKLSPGDELLEVNGQKLLGIRHVEVVRILRDLPNTVRLVCSREHKNNRVINTSQDREAFEARNILGGSLKNLLPQPEQKLLKALSDTSLNTSSTTTTDIDGQQKIKSRSLEVINLVLWSEEIEYLQLNKTERGLGFSILDYQDPLDPKRTVILVRSLVPHGAAEQNGKLKPGDKLISVNGVSIATATLDQAVQVLKAVPQGVVTLGISKPLPSRRNSDTLSNFSMNS
ncbi:patj homolog isoform X3 [Diorhabda sublineata]|uniref:patj homolog isoform X3 n=1 Tax=Diorhabda sublineata TaxID=1163346 RepID=UPI0024E0F238|nr:patj homolog isoform X3 [Diorhabda sublineata]